MIWRTTLRYHHSFPNKQCSLFQVSEFLLDHGRNTIRFNNLKTFKQRAHFKVSIPKIVRLHPLWWHLDCPFKSNASEAWNPQTISIVILLGGLFHNLSLLLIVNIKKHPQSGGQHPSADDMGAVASADGGRFASQLVRVALLGAALLLCAALGPRAEPRPGVRGLCRPAGHRLPVRGLAALWRWW